MNYDAIRSRFPERALQTVEGLPFPKVATGKVREIFDLGDRLLIVATDRLSAFDVVLPDGIPGKGIVLTQMSLFWFARAADLIDHHLVPDHDATVRRLLPDHPELHLRSMVVRKLKPLPVEAVVRGYLSGSGWKDYRQTGRLFSQEVPAGLRESDALPRPYFTPTTKAQTGHDEPLTLAQCREMLGPAVHDPVMTASLELFRRGGEIARRAGILLADTKFEFGRDAAGRIYLIDEVLTPDSSRFWPLDGYRPGGPQPSYDKQFVRDYLETLAWDKTPPGPPLPPAVVAGTRERYEQALARVLSAP